MPNDPHTGSYTFPTPPIPPKDFIPPAAKPTIKNSKYITLNRTENQGIVSLRKDTVYRVSKEQTGTLIGWKNGGGFDKCDYVIESVEAVTAELEKD